MPEIEVFEPFHFGIKIRPPIDLNMVENLIDSLKKDESIIIKMDNVDPNIPPIFTIGEKDNVIIQLNLPSNSINVIGKGPDPIENVMDVKGILLNALEEELKIELKRAISFYELIIGVNILTNETPLDVFRKINLDMTEFEKFNASVNGIKIASNEIDDEKDIFEYLLEPKFLSPDNRYYLTMLRRSRSLDDIIDFQKDIRSFIINSIKKIEGS